MTHRGWTRALLPALLAISIAGCGAEGEGAYPGTYEGTWSIDVNADGTASPESGTMVVRQVDPFIYAFETPSGSCSEVRMAGSPGERLEVEDTTCGSLDSLTGHATLDGNSIFFTLRGVLRATGGFEAQPIEYEFSGERLAE